MRSLKWGAAGPSPPPAPGGGPALGLSHWSECHPYLRVCRNAGGWAPQSEVLLNRLLSFVPPVPRVPRPALKA